MKVSQGPFGAEARTKDADDSRPSRHIVVCITRTNHAYGFIDSFYTVEIALGLRPNVDFSTVVDCMENTGMLPDTFYQTGRGSLGKYAPEYHWIHERYRER